MGLRMFQVDGFKPSSLAKRSSVVFDLCGAPVVSRGTVSSDSVEHFLAGGELISRDAGAWLHLRLYVRNSAKAGAGSPWSTTVTILGESCPNPLWEVRLRTGNANAELEFGLRPDTVLYVSHV